jgi:hypothetical protein
MHITQFWTFRWLTRRVSAAIQMCSTPMIALDAAFQGEPTFVQLYSLKSIVRTYTLAKFLAVANPHGWMVNVGGCE